MIGTTLGRYAIVEKLGAGGMGVVYRAKDTSLDRDVALKVLPRGMAENTDRRKRFEREARAVASLNHPNIVTIHAVEEIDGTVFLALELVLGRTLTELQPDGGFAVKQFLDLAVPLTDAVAVAHEQGITHRDLKPDNIMVTERGTLKVLDFGLARLREEAIDPEFAPTITQEGVVVGTVPYMSPEQLEGKAIDHRTDLFSLGVIFHEMLIGERPFQGDSTASLMSSILNTKPRSVSELRRGVHPSLARIIDRCLEKKPGHRFDTADEVKTGLEGVRREMESRGSSRTSTSMRAAARRKMIVVLPFENLGQAEDTYFAQGITDEVTTRLSGVEGLGVISRKSANQYADTDKSVQEIGTELGVDYIVEGTVRWAGKRTRIAPRLVHIADDTQVWGDIFDRTLDDIFEIQSELAEKIIEALGIALHESERESLDVQYTDNVEAYQAYIRGHEAWPLLTEAAIREALREFGTAIDLDPGFVKAWLEKAICLSAMVHTGYERTDAQRALAREACEQISALAPDSPESYLAWGYYHYHGQRQYRTAEFFFGLAEKSRSHRTEARDARAYILRRIGKFKESERIMLESLELNPRDVNLLGSLGATYINLREYDRAIQMFNRSVEIRPEFELAKAMASVAHLLKGDLPAAEKSIRRTDPSGGSIAMYVWAWILLNAGHYQELLGLLEAYPEEMISYPPRIYPVSFYKAFALRGLGRLDEATRRFEESRKWLEARRADDPTDPGFPGPLGVTHAALGNPNRAVQNLMIGLDMYPPAGDTYFGSMMLEDLAWGYTLLGQSDKALDVLEDLVDLEGSSFSRSYVRVDTRWDPLRHSPRYARMMEDE